MEHRLKIRESRNIENTWILLKSVEKPWNMKATVVPVIDGVLGAVPCLEKRLEEQEIGKRIEIIHTPTLLKSAGILS